MKLRISILFLENKEIFNFRFDRTFFIFIAIIFIGMRGYLEADWLLYYPYFKQSPQFSDGLTRIVTFTLGSFYEPGYALLNIITKSIYNNYLFLQFICSVLPLIVIDKFFKEYFKEYADECYFLAWIFFFCFNGFVLEIIVLRSAMGLMCFFISMKYIEEKNFFKYFAWNLLGISFHIGSIIYIPMYFIVNKRYKNATYVMCFVLGLSVFVLRISIMRNLLSVFAAIFTGRFQSVYQSRVLVEDSIAALGYSIGFFERIFTFFLVFYFFNKILNEDERMIIFWNMMMLYICTYLFCWDLYVFNERLPVLLSCSYWILYPKVYKNMSKQKKIVFIVILLIYTVLKTDLLLGDKKAYYENVLFGISNRATREAYYTY